MFWTDEDENMVQDDLTLNSIVIFITISLELYYIQLLLYLLAVKSSSYSSDDICLSDTLENPP